MTAKRSHEFQDFDKVMDGLLAVPYKELREKLEEEKKAKAASPKRRISNGKKKREGT